MKKNRWIGLTLSSIGLVGSLLGGCGTSDVTPGSLDGGTPPDGFSLPTEESVAECSDSADNDGDGATDCDDLACSVYAFCTSTPETGDALCANGADDDDDGATDCADTGCASAAACTPPPPETGNGPCSNGADDDADGAIDCADSGCASAAVCAVPVSEQGNVLCQNGIDDDRDGSTDCADAGCDSAAACLVSPGTEDTLAACGNGLDDDSDGAIDCADSGCAGIPACIAAALTVTWEHPGLVPDGATLMFPTYIAHLFGTGVIHPLEMETTCASLSNAGALPITADLVVRFAGYGADATQSVTLGASSSSRVCLNPTFDLAALYALRAPASARVESSVRIGGTEVATNMAAVRVMTANDVIWSHPTVDLASMRDLSAVYVEPNATAVEGLVASVAARVKFTGGAGAAGYVRNGYTRPTINLSVGYYTSELTFLEAGEQTSWALTSVVGGSTSDVDVRVYDQAQFALWTAGSVATSTAWPDRVTSSTGVFTAPAAGWYHFVILNTPDNWVSRDVTWYRTPSREEVARDSLMAIFSELRARGITYTSISTSFFAGAQHVRRAQEVIDSSTGNCIDGTFLFSSLLALMDLEPVIIFKSGHAFVAVRAEPGSDSRLWFMETTMVGGTSTPFSAYSYALDEYNAAVTDGDPYLDPVPVPDARALGITPLPL